MVGTAAVADGVRESAPPGGAAISIRRLGLVDYESTVDSMRAFTESRDRSTRDELWLLEHPAVYTLGQGADRAHGPRIDNGIPVIACGRGGEITYHGPGQLVVYTLVDLGRRALGVREFVRLLEDAVIELCADHEVRASRREGAPGVYVEGAKLAALGIRVTRGRAWHGLALNVDLDLGPFAAIDPCGYAGLPVTRTRDLGMAGGVDSLGDALAAILVRRIGDA